MEIQGKVIAVMEPKSGVSNASGNPWMLQEYVIETHDQFPRKMLFEVFGEEKIRQFSIQVGEELTVFFDINAREWNGRYFNSIRAWRVDRYDPNAPQNPIPAAGTAVPNQAPFPPAQPAAQPAQPAQPVQPQQPDFLQQNAEEDLPF